MYSINTHNGQEESLKEAEAGTIVDTIMCLWNTTPK